MKSEKELDKNFLKSLNIDEEIEYLEGVKRMKNFEFNYRDEFVFTVNAKDKGEAWNKVCLGKIDKIEILTEPHSDMLELL